MSDRNQPNDDHDSQKVYEDDLERQWSEASSIKGVDPSLLHARIRRHISEPPPRRASFAPVLIPYAAIMAGPLIASLLTLFADGDPPTGRQAVSVLALAGVAWVLNVGLSTINQPLLSPGGDAALSLGILFISGTIFWILYRFWFNGSRQIDQQGLTNSAILFIALSALFWLGRDASWLTWLGR